MDEPPVKKKPRVLVLCVGFWSSTVRVEGFEGLGLRVSGFWVPFSRVLKLFQFRA